MQSARLICTSALVEVAWILVQKAMRIAPPIMISVKPSTALALNRLPKPFAPRP